MENIIGKQVRVTKVSDDRFGGNHPNGIDTGYIIEGTLRLENPAIFVESETKWFHTSEVKSSEKISDTKFKVETKNSTYEVEVLS